MDKSIFGAIPTKLFAYLFHMIGTAEGPSNEGTVDDPVKNNALASFYKTLGISRYGLNVDM